MGLPTPRGLREDPESLFATRRVMFEYSRQLWLVPPGTNMEGAHESTSMKGASRHEYGWSL